MVFKSQSFCSLKNWMPLSFNRLCISRRRSPACRTGRGRFSVLADATSAGHSVRCSAEPCLALSAVSFSTKLFFIATGRILLVNFFWARLDASCKAGTDRARSVGFVQCFSQKFINLLRSRSQPSRRVIYTNERNSRRKDLVEARRRNGLWKQ